MSQVDLVGEASSDYECSINISSDTKDSVNTLLTPAKYTALPETKITRDLWILGYRDQAPRSYNQFSPWSARRISLTSVAEIEIELLYRHLLVPKDYPLFAARNSVRSPPTSQWIDRLISSTRSRYSIAKSRGIFFGPPLRQYLLSPSDGLRN